MEKADNRVYHECMQLTSQVKFCPNAFRVDLYRGCDFGCKYCFANMEAFKECGTGLSMWREARIEDIERKLYTAFETDKESKSVVIELLRNRVPIHCGGMSDPFQSREWKMGLTYKFIQLMNRYDYPISFSTKTNWIPKEYFEILNPKIHAFQVSMMGVNYDYVRKWETNTPRPTDRAEFVKYLKDSGFWCSVRIQPIIDVEECLYMMDYFEDVPSYYSIEHLHVIPDSHTARKAIMDNIDNKQDLTNNGSVIEFKRDVRVANAKRLIECANKYGVKVGVADNDLHYMSQSRCCCGIDTIDSGAFDNYLKFNSCYLSTGACDDISKLFVPTSNCRRHFNIGAQKPTVFVRDVVKKHIKDNPNLIPDVYRESVERQLFGNSKKRLF